MFKSEDGSIVRPTAKAEETRRRILATALDLFQGRGFTETTMREIARKAEVATGAAYYYFPSKEAIIMAFYWQTQTEFEAAFRKPLARTRDLGERIRMLVELKLEQFQPYRGVLGALFRSAGDPASPLSPFSEETRDIREQSITSRLRWRARTSNSRPTSPRTCPRSCGSIRWASSCSGSTTARRGRRGLGSCSKKVVISSRKRSSSRAFGS